VQARQFSKGSRRSDGRCGCSVLEARRGRPIWQAWTCDEGRADKSDASAEDVETKTTIARGRRRCCVFLCAVCVSTSLHDQGAINKAGGGGGRPSEDGPMERFVVRLFFVMDFVGGEFK
jgi:hypothetical protein